MASESGLFLMTRNQRYGLSSLHESLARQLIFKHAARPVDLLALERAVALEINDPSFGRPEGSSLNGTEEDVALGERGGAEADGTEEDPGEASAGHAPFIPDPSRNRPEPAPLPTDSDAPPRRRPGAGDPGGSGDEGDRTRRTPELEQKHKLALKHAHYASHCQICLCERSPEELAPPGSYVEWEEVRQHIVEAHHPDLVSAGGARHAGNLILLCKLHHDNYGRLLSRGGVTAALQDGRTKRSVSFGEDTKVIGQQVKVTVSATGEVVKLFFTEEHLAHWLSADGAPCVGVAATVVVFGSAPLTPTSWPHACVRKQVAQRIWPYQM